MRFGKELPRFGGFWSSGSGAHSKRVNHEDNYD